MYCNALCKVITPLLVVLPPSSPSPTQMLLHIVTALSLWDVSLIVLDAEQLWMPLGLLLSLPKVAVGMDIIKSYHKSILNV